MSRSYSCGAAPELAAQLMAKSEKLTVALRSVGLTRVLIDNSVLRSNTAGIGMRNSMFLDDKASQTAYWGQTICAVGIDEEWVQVMSSQFLPRKLNGVQVLKPMDPGPLASIINGSLAELNALCGQSAIEIEALQSERAALNFEISKLKEELMAIREHTKALEGEVSSTILNVVVEHFLVDNSELGSDTDGLIMRKTMSLSDKIPEEMVDWGKTICAVVLDENWVKVKSNQFLPRKIRGRRVLKPVDFDPLASLSYVYSSLVELQTQSATEMRTLQSHNSKLKEDLMAIREHTKALEGEVSSTIFNAAAEYFLVDRSGLEVDTDGLAMCKTMSLDDKAPQTAHWGQTICAVVIDEEWVKVTSSQFLPRKLNGVQVLKPVDPDPIASLDFVKTYLEVLQSYSDKLAMENACLKEWPSNTLYPWRLKETLQPAVWHCVDSAPATLMQANCTQDSSIWSTIVRMFQNDGRNPCHVLSITALHSEDGLKIFEGTLARLEQRRQQGGIFNARMRDDDPHRWSTIERLKQHFLKQPPSFKLANVIFVWHGGSIDAIDGIARNGFADLKRTDEGWFGSGLYSTTDSQYACMYSTGEVSSLGPVGPGPWKVVLAAMAMSNAFPVTRADYLAGQQSCKYQGKPLETGYSAHAVVVDPNGGYQAARNPDVSEVQPMEVVAAQEAQLLPVAVIEFR